MLPAALSLLLATLLTAAGAPATAPPCESEINKIKDLLQVSCVGRGLSSVPPGLPKDTGILLLGSNRLSHVSLASFQHLSDLVELDLSNNSLTTLDTSGALLPGLQQLDLSHNGLQSLPALQGMPALKRLALAHNALSRLPAGGFRALRALEDLELQGNGIRDLPEGAFEGLEKLKDVDLADNQLEQLPRELLAGLGSLEILRMERNRLQRLPDGFFPEDNVFAYLYLAENPWVCDCGLVYLRDYILEYEISVYTRVQGPGKEITENKPESVECEAPAAEKGRPVMYFQAHCTEGPEGDSDGGGGGIWGESTESAPTPTPTPVHTTLVTTTASLAATSSITTSVRTRPSTTSPATTAITTPSTTSPATSALTTPSTAAPATSVLTTPSTASPATSVRTTPSTAAPATTVPTFAPSTSDPSLGPTPLPTAMSATSHPLPTAMASPPPPQLSPSVPSGCPPPAAPCHCSLLPVTDPRRSWRWSPRTLAERLAAHCCLLRLVLYVACLALAGLPSLALLCWLGWLYASWQRPPLRGRHGTRLVKYSQLQRDDPRGWQPEGPEAQSPLAMPRTYRVCEVFEAGPSRHVSWLFVSLPGPTQKWPWQRRRGRAPSSYSLGRGQDAIGAVRVKYGTGTL